MERNNGYLDITNKIDTLDEDIVMSGVGILDNKKVYFKSGKGFPLKELIAEEALKKFNIKCAHYELVKINDITGVLSYDVKDKGDTYISGTEFLSHFLKKEILAYTDNTLENIWMSIESNYPNMSQEEVYKIVNDFIKLFLFDTITNISDRHYNNWGLIEKDNKVSLAPVFDNELFLAPYNDLACCMRVEQDTVGNSNIERFLNISSNEYYDMFVNMYNEFSLDFLEDCIVKAENRVKIKLSDADRNKLITNYNNRKKELDEIIEKYKVRHRKLI